MALRRTRSAVLLASCALVLAACGSGGSADGGSDGRLSVVTSFYPLQYVTERVAGDHADVTNLTKPGGEPHDLELSPKQVASVQDADLVVYQDEFQTAVDEAVKEADREPGTTVDAADGVDRIEESEEAHAEGEEEGHDDHAHGDEEHADEYEANAAALVADLQKLDGEYRAGLTTCKVRDIVTSHAAFAYLARAYDLVQIPIAGIDPSTEPSAAQLAEISDLVKRDGITTVFTETLVSPAVARTVAREAGVQTATLDPIEGLTKDTSDQDYFSIMRSNLAELQKANSCS